MYEDLIKRLRNVSMELGQADHVSALLLEATDAIEAKDRHILTLQHEMMAEAESHIAEVDRLNKQIEGLSKMEKTTRWIPVTEQLPIFDKVVQITDGVDVGHGYLEGVRSTSGIAYMWQSPFCDIDEERITHWMPLPEPPKEE